MNCTLPAAMVPGVTVISILVENKGRVNEEIVDFRWARKGIYGNVTVGEELLTPWNITSVRAKTNAEFGRYGIVSRRSKRAGSW